MRSITRFFAFLLGAWMLCSTLGATEVLFKRGYAEIVAEQDDIDTIRTKVGYKTILLFPADDDIVRVEVGIRGSVLEVKYGRNWVALRPSEEKVATNIHVATERGRIFSFDLVEGTKQDFHRKVVVLRPDMEQEPETAPAPRQAPSQPNQPGAAGLPAPTSPTTPVRTPSGRNVTVDSLDPQPGPQPGSKGGPKAPPVPGTITPDTPRGVPGVEFVRKSDRRYKIENQKPKLLEVDSVVNDGERTFVRFKSALNESPLFFHVDSAGKRNILNYRQESGNDPRDRDVFVIPRLVDKGVVRIGDAESIFTWLQTN